MYDDDRYGVEKFISVREIVADMNTRDVYFVCACVFFPFHALIKWM